MERTFDLRLSEIPRLEYRPPPAPPRNRLGEMKRKIGDLEKKRTNRSVLHTRTESESVHSQSRFDRSDTFGYRARISNRSCERAQKVIQESWANSPPPVKLKIKRNATLNRRFPTNFPKLEVSQRSYCESPGVGTYKPKKVKGHCFQPIIMTSSRGEETKVLTTSYVDYLPVKNEFGSRNQALKFNGQKAREYLGKIGKQIESMRIGKLKHEQEKKLRLAADELNVHKDDSSLDYKLVTNFYAADVLNNRSDDIYEFKQRIRKEIESSGWNSMKG